MLLRGSGSTYVHCQRFILMNAKREGLFNCLFVCFLHFFFNQSKYIIQTRDKMQWAGLLRVFFSFLFELLL